MFPLEIISPTSTCNSTVAIGASNCPLANIIWNSGEGPSFIIGCGATLRIFRRLASGMVFDNAPASMSPSMVNSLKSIRKYSALRSFFNGKFVDSGRNLLGPSGVTRNCGKIWSSMVALCPC